MRLGSTVLFQGSEEHNLSDYFRLHFFSFMFSEYIVPDVSNLKYEQPHPISANRTSAIGWGFLDFRRQQQQQKTTYLFSVPVAYMKIPFFSL